MPWRERQKTPTLIEDLFKDSERFWRQVQKALEAGGTVGIRTPLLERLMGPLAEEYGGQQWLILRPRARTRNFLFVFRLRDVVVSLIGLLVVFPLVLLLGILIKVGSAGPIIFSTTVVGGRKLSFRWYKLRSMIVISEDADRAQREARFAAYAKGENTSSVSGTGATKLIDLKRVTPLGRRLRKHSLDELPQLWNVLRGEMTLVGPRPCLPYEASFFNGWRERRFDVPAGMTGVWQLFGRGATSFDELAAMDVYYVLRKSFRFDLYLLARTVVEIFRAKGAV